MITMQADRDSITCSQDAGGGREEEVGSRRLLMKTSRMTMEEMEIGRRKVVQRTTCGWSDRRTLKRG